MTNQPLDAAIAAATRHLKQTGGSFGWTDASRVEFLFRVRDPNAFLSAICAAVAPAPTHVAAPDWQPIETAPHDGSVVLVVNERGVFAAQFIDPQQHPILRTRELTAGWWIDDGKYNLRRVRGGSPTHWLEIPPQPSTVLAETPSRAM